MRYTVIPGQSWSWRGSALIFVLVAAPQVALLGVAPEARSVSVAAAVGALVTYCAVLLTGLLVYLQYRVHGAHATAWLAAALMVASVEGVSWAGLRLASPDRAGPTSLWQMVVDLVCTLGLLTMVILGRRSTLRVDPMALGISLGLVVGSSRLFLVQKAPLVRMSDELLAVLVLALLVIYAAIAYCILFRMPGIPTWVTGRLAASVALLSLSQALANQPPATAWLASLTVVLSPVGAVLLCSTALAWLRQTVRENELEIASLSDRISSVEASVQQDRELRHEINGTIAGIASASRLLHHHPDLPAQQTQELQHMVDSEVERLELLVSDEPTDVRCAEVDEIIRPLVTSQRVQGRTVHWQPAGHLVRAREQDLAEVINILLHNATRHAPGTDTTVRTDRVGENVRVVVSDSGPGVEPGLRSHIFEWERRGTTSVGQGIGLALASRLMHEQGGSVRLVESSDTGATFVVELPAGGGDDDRPAAQ